MPHTLVVTPGAGAHAHPAANTPAPDRPRGVYPLLHTLPGVTTYVIVGSTGVLGTFQLLESVDGPDVAMQLAHFLESKDPQPDLRVLR